ncbi:putative lipoprotein [Leptospira inadai serovar Lyme str. 10]|uniref:Lipoprotein n=2 Tax=Leptospira inadai serovar Lyme TaxID=293084 RepID=A0ABX4YNQ7_9LEPT|nr:hypothetical protein [Leptospira inadai]EQA35945.1 putative lipoprotein [Leptospira inadai serovar Lyme str. 10]PNV76917.1 hypothetical protein BES34_001175 [Leptospira inadai serovar Lyme]
MPIVIKKNSFFVRSFLIIIGSVFLVACVNQGEQSSNKGADPGLILQSLLQNSPDPLKACVNANEEEETCLKSTQDLSGINESSLAKIISGNRYSTYSQYCTSLLSSESFSKLNVKAQECVMTCNEAYWSALGSAGRCQGQSSDLISTEGSDTLSCIRNCSNISSGL